jgi:3-dehydroquinate synthase
MKSLTVDLGARSYPIYAGQSLLTDPSLYARHLAGRNVLIVTDSNVAPLYLRQVVESLGNHHVGEVVLQAGEAHKTLDAVSSIYDALMAQKFDRSSTIVALGGGVVGDIAGFAAASFQRGIQFLQVPTTLLAQVDSSVGGKTGVNHPAGKNMIGAFHQPTAVIADIETLTTLPPREYAAGLAEVIKYGLINQPQFFDWLGEHLDALLQLDAEAVAEAVLSCCQFKADIVAADERESGQRALLNLGHTFGHAIENAMGYGVWLHGEAVAAGICLAAHFSARSGFMPEADVIRIEQLLHRAGLPTAAPEAITAEQFLDLMSRDKKVRDQVLTLVLMRGIGQSFLTSDYDRGALRQMLTDRPTGIATAHR